MFLIWTPAGAGEARVPSARDEKNNRLWSFIFYFVAVRNAIEKEEIVEGFAVACSKNEWPCLISHLKGRGHVFLMYEETSNTSALNHIIVVQGIDFRHHGDRCNCRSLGCVVTFEKRFMPLWYASTSAAILGDVLVNAENLVCR